MTSVRIGGSLFKLNVFQSEEALRRGLGHQSELPSDEGALFVFPVREQQVFVMRDCAYPLDVLFIDENNRIVQMLAMLPETPRSAQERATIPMEDFAYESRLTQYVCETPVKRAIELHGGSIARLRLELNDIVKFE